MSRARAGPRDRGERRPRLDVLAVRGAGHHLDRGIEQREGGERGVQARHPAGGAGDDRGLGRAGPRAAMASLVRSPARPRSSSSARRTSGS